jgi:predicted MFS family arabinose efflux permease
MDSSPSVARASLLVLGAAAFLVSADARVVDPLLHVIAQQFGVSVDRAAIVASAYTFPYGLFQLFYGPMGDRVGKLRVMSVALTLFAFGTAACALVNDLTVFAVLRFVTGVVAAAIIPLSLGYIGDKVPLAGRQVALGRFMSALMLGQILSSSLGGVFGQYLSWRGVFWVFGALSLVAATALYRESRAFPEPARPERSFSRAFWSSAACRSWGRR